MSDIEGCCALAESVLCSVELSDGFSQTRKIAFRYIMNIK